LAALAVRIGPVVAKNDIGRAMEVGGDSVVYIALANGLKRGCGFDWWASNHCAVEPETMRPPGYPPFLSLTVPETNRTPGYPVFLSLMPGLRTALIVQGLLGSLLCFFIGLFAAAIAGAGAGYCAAGILAVDLPSIVYCNQLMSETFFTALLVGAMLVELEALRNGWNAPKVYGLFALGSAMLGLALLVRPIAEYIVPIVILAPMLSSEIAWTRRVSLAALVAAGPIICGAIWMLRNYSVAGVAAISTIGAVDLFYYRALGTVAFASHSGLTEILMRAHPRPEISLGAQGIHIILQHPFAFAAMTLWSFFYLCWVPLRAPLAQVFGMAWAWRIFQPGSVRTEALLHELWTGNFSKLGTIFTREFSSSIVLPSLVGFQLLTIGFTWVGVFLALKRHASLRSPIGSFVLFIFAIAMITLLLASGPEAYARYRVPAMPLLALLAGVGWFGVRQIDTRHP
jgi:hypothetical protein